MKPSHIIVPAIAATTAFTLFSYIVSSLYGRNYREPELLGDMINRTSSDLDHDESQFTGWLIHYLVGIGFAAAYHVLVKQTGMKPNFKNGAVAGAVSGFPAVLAWHATLDMHPAPPRKKTWDYYTELFLGHIIFGAVCFEIMGRLKSGATPAFLRKKTMRSVR